MSVLLPEDSKAPGAIQLSSLHSLPFVPEGSMQAVAIINALVRLLDAKLIDKTSGNAVALALQTLNATTSITTPSANITTQTTSTITVSTLATILQAVITNLQATTSSIGAATADSLTTDTLVVNGVIATLSIALATITSLSSDDITVEDLTAVLATITTGTITNLTSTTATIDSLTVNSLKAKGITYDQTLVSAIVPAFSYAHTGDVTTQTFTGSHSPETTINFFAKIIEGYVSFVLTASDITAPLTPVDESTTLVFKVRIGFNPTPDANPVLAAAGAGTGTIVFENYELVSVTNWPVMLGTAPVIGLKLDGEFYFDFNGTQIEPIKLSRKQVGNGDLSKTILVIQSGFVDNNNYLIDYDSGNNIYTKSITMSTQLEARG